MTDQNYPPNWHEVNGQHIPPSTHQFQGNPTRRYDAVANAVIIGASLKAGKNHYDQTGEMGEATNAAMGAFVRWNVWAITLFAWWFVLILNGLNMRGPALPIYLFLIAPFTLGVTWCRHSDYSLFRRGVIYRIFAPVARLVEPVPTFIFYLLMVPAVL